MTTYQRTYPGSDYVAQSRVVHSGQRMNGLNRWSVQLMRTRSRFGANERRGWTLFVSCGGFRAEVGTR